jgi:hypothetical protein
MDIAWSPNTSLHVGLGRVCLLQIQPWWLETEAEVLSRTLQHCNDKTELRMSEFYQASYVTRKGLA